MTDKIQIDIKPLSVNKAYRGRKFRTPEHSKFKKAMDRLLPKKIDLPEPPFTIHLEFGLSSSNADGDGPLKLTQDSIADKYGFNDKLIRKWVVEAFRCKKGEEFIRFRIEHYEPTKS